MRESLAPGKGDQHLTVPCICDPSALQRMRVDEGRASREAAQALGISRGSAYELVQRGELRCVRAGRRTLIPRDAVRQFLGVTDETPHVQGASAESRHLIEGAYLVSIRRVRPDAMPAFAYP